jgi:hypothetical protein
VGVLEHETGGGRALPGLGAGEGLGGVLDDLRVGQDAGDLRTDAAEPIRRVTGAVERKNAVDEAVSGRSKPATSGRIKTSHFEVM